MSNTIGNPRVLDASRKEALQGLLSSLGHVSDKPSSDGKLSAEQVRKLSHKINEILGDGSPTRGDQPSQLLNEDGLPIIDISEPVDEDSETSISPSYIPEQDFVPLSLLPPDEREWRRRERDRILGLLEEEEHSQRLQEERDAEEERKEAIRKRKESAKAQVEQLKVARELQKKMGQALVRNANGTGEKKQEDARSRPWITSPVAKKSVSFADVPAVEAENKDQETSIRQPVWGDVTPARLRAQTRIPLVGATEAQKYPMKMHVVERHPTATPTPPSHNDAADSDDESPSAGYLSPHVENHSPDDEERSLSGDNLLDGEPLEEEFDYDAAQHHREIALEYYKKRHDIGAETARAMVAHTPDDYEQETSNGQSPLSHFRADRMAAAYDRSHGPVSTSIGQTVIPASRLKSLRNSVKLGKLEDDQLVGGDSGESGSEDETVREVIQMIRTGGIQNTGPDFKPSPTSTVTSRQNSDAVESTTVGTSTTAHGVKPSRFRLAREGWITEGTTFQDNNSKDNVRSQPTISNVVERKAPRSPASQRFPINKPPPRSSVNVSEPMTIDSPLFRVTASTPTVTSSPSSACPMKTGPLSPHHTQLGLSSLVQPHLQSKIR